MQEKGLPRRLFFRRRSFLKHGTTMLAGASFLGGVELLTSQTAEGGSMLPPSLRIALLTEQGAPHLDIYIDAIAQASGVREVVLGDISGHIFEAAQRSLSGKFGEVPKYTNFNQLFSEHKSDLVILSFPAHDAPAVIEMALKRGSHVLAEKPACVRLEDFERLTHLAQEQHRNLMLAFSTHENPLVIKARDFIRNGELGKLFGASMVFLADQTRLRNPAYQKSWFASKAAAGGGHLIWLGIHYVDIIQFITGQQITKICGFIENVGGQPINVEDSTSVCMQFDGGLLATFQSGYYLDRDYQSQIHIWGSGGWLKADLASTAPLQWYSSRTGKVEIFAPDPNGRKAAYPHFVQAVIDSVRHGTPPPVTAQESLQALKAVFGLYASASSGITQKLL